jgi:hypothetical protein
MVDCADGTLQAALVGTFVTVTLSNVTEDESAQIQVSHLAC